ncbi:MAG: hypothetical protein M0C28_05820 [Candidatus Moduliflexus flocculans]|nr:hypothetical protein [Candidatus Moduliflexus flocculans]
MHRLRPLHCRACPTRAIRVEDGKARSSTELCIDCAECLRVAPTRPLRPHMTSFASLGRLRIQSGHPLDRALRPARADHRPQRDPVGAAAGRVRRGHDLSSICEPTAPRPRSTSTSTPGPGRSSPRPVPVVVRSIQRRYPTLCGQILPIEPPREIAAKILRTILPKSLGIPRREDRHHPHHALPGQDGVHQQPGHPGQVLPRRGHLDPGHLPPDPPGPAQERGGRPRLRHLFPETLFSGIGMGWPLSGGETRGLKSHRAVAVSGIRDTMRVLDEVEGGLLQDIDVLECTVCPDGCVGGPLGVEDRFLAKSRVLRARRRGRRARRRRPEGRQPALPQELPVVRPPRVARPNPGPSTRDPAKAIRKAKRREKRLRRSAAQGLRRLRGARLPDAGRRHRPRATPASRTARSSKPSRRRRAPGRGARAEAGRRQEEKP